MNSNGTVASKQKFILASHIREQNFTCRSLDDALLPGFKLVFRLSTRACQASQEVSHTAFSISLSREELAPSKFQELSYPWKGGRIAMTQDVEPKNMLVVFFGHLASHI